MEGHLPFLEKAFVALNPGLKNFSLKIVDAKLHFRASIDVYTIAPLISLPVESVHIHNSPLKDITPLRGAGTLKVLSLKNTLLSDLEALKGLNLDYLEITQTLVRNLEALENSSIKSLRMRGLKVLNLGSLLEVDGLEMVDLDHHRFDRGFHEKDYLELKSRGLLKFEP